MSASHQYLFTARFDLNNDFVFLMEGGFGKKCEIFLKFGKSQQAKTLLGLYSCI